MNENDLDQVMDIENACFSYPWKRGFFVADLNRPTSFLLVAKDGERLLGYAVVWRAEDELHLANIAVGPDRRREGIGSQLLGQVLALGRELGCRRMYLEVRVSNLAAQSFYKKHGFFHTYTREEYYPNKEAALVFEKELVEPIGNARNPN